jgi:hypothetical protein
MGGRLQLPRHSYLGHVATGSTERIELNLFPGEEGRLSIVPDHLKIAGQPGQYVADFLLIRPDHSPVPEGHFDFFSTTPGDSHLAIAKPAAIHPNVPDVASIRIQTGIADQAIAFRGYPNPQGFLGRIESDPFQSDSFEDAHSKAHHLLAPILSTFAAELDLPVRVYRTLLIEQQTGARSMRMTMPALEAALNYPPHPVIGTEYSYYASLYREGLNSSSIAYRFLCLFKIAEGIRARRTRVTKERLADGKPPIRIIERFPLSSADLVHWLSSTYVRDWHDRALEQIFRPEIRGKKFNHVIDVHLVPLRNTVAHAILDSGELGMSSDDILKLDKVQYWLPATRVIVRRMLRNEFPSEFLLHLPPTGDVLV